MPMPGFMTITGENQGPIQGSCDLKGLEGKIEVFSFNHKVEIPRKSDTGSHLGNRVHSNITVLKETDKSTPKLYQALCTGEQLTEVTFSWYRYTEIKGDLKYYTVHIENSIITCIDPWVPNRLDPANAGYHHMENVSFLYGKIRWTWEIGIIEYEDCWLSPEA